MADDLGWGDVGFNGNATIQTPHLDAMAENGVTFKRFYAAAPVCSPTRGSCLTGRHPYRYGIFYANVGHLLQSELNLAKVLKANGYTTGHFGKWHLGTLTKTIVDSNRGKNHPEHYAPPWEHGFDACFSTEAKVPTFNPMDFAVSTRYWTGDGQYATENLDGDDSRVIMDRAIPFIKNAVQHEQPFLAVIWFHTPHSPVVAGPEHRKLYSNYNENQQHYYGCITAMDEQIGRLRRALRELDASRDTMLWFCSDNGPAGKGGGPAQEPGGRQQGSPGPFRGRKGSLYEGGVRVPAIVEWPTVIEPGESEFPACTSDYYPTILDILRIEPPEQPKPVDGISLWPHLQGNMSKRPTPIGFESELHQKTQVALTDNRYKLISVDDEESFQLYDLIVDPSESRDVAEDHPDIFREMKHTLQTWRQSCAASNRGED